jgi:hypothetical protein
MRFIKSGLIALWLTAAALPVSAVASPDKTGGKPVQGKADATGIEWEVSPAHVVVFLDGKRLGEAGALKFTATSPGKHVVKLLNGKDETESDIPLKKGQKLKFVYNFDAG